MHHLAPHHAGASAHDAYIPSPLEAAWERPNVTNCRLVKQQRHDPAIQTWLRLSYDALLNSKPVYEASHVERAVLSQMPRRAGSCGAQPIEPLTGALRHPLASGMCYSREHKRDEIISFLNFTHLIVSDHCKPGCRRTITASGSSDRHVRARRNIYYDLGCAAYADVSRGTQFKVAVIRAKQRNTSVEYEVARIDQQHEEKLMTRTTIFPIGASIPTFRSLYRRNCIEFDEIYAWDAHPYTMKSWYSRVPPSNRANITFINKPVDASDSSALGVLRRTARPEDFVVFKLDIDTPKVEQQILDVLLSDDATLGLIDEFFVEYQAGKTWEDLGDADPATRHNVARAVQMLATLRRRGVRAHFWV